jgi:hypothetical protein
MSDATLVEGQSVWLVASLLEGAPAGDGRLPGSKAGSILASKTVCALRL